MQTKNINCRDSKKLITQSIAAMRLNLSNQKCLNVTVPLCREAA